jgi:hypothetical protein
MPLVYKLLKPIDVISKKGQKVTIPAGARVKLESLDDEIGLCFTLWRGIRFIACGEEIRQSGMSHAILG